MHFNPRINHRKWQIVLIPLCAFIVANILAYESNAPIHPIPWNLTWILALFTFVIWEVNRVTYRVLDRSNAFYDNPAKRLVKQLGYCTLATWLTYTILYVLVFLLKGGSLKRFPIDNFLLYWLVATGIALVINALYVIRYLQSTLQYKEAISTERMNQLLEKVTVEQTVSIKAVVEQNDVLPESPIPASQQLLIQSGNKQLPISFSEMAYWYSSEGLVVLVLTNGRKITTNFTSYAEFIERLPATQFFQLNRQFVTHIQSIHSIQDASNRKLEVTLQTGISGTRMEQVTVSRYRSQQLKSWFAEQHAGVK